MLIDMECIQCGECCKKYGHLSLATIGPEEYKRFENRPDVQAYCYEIMDGMLWDIWVHPKDKTLKKCPWLRKYPGKNKYYCSINDIKPNVCRLYPVSYEQQLRDKCKGTLEFIMRDILRFTQVFECDNQHEINALLNDNWLIIDTIPISYVDGGGFIRALMGNLGEYVEYKEIKRIVGREN